MATQTSPMSGWRDFTFSSHRSLNLSASSGLILSRKRSPNQSSPWRCRENTTWSAITSGKEEAAFMRLRIVNIDQSIRALA